MPACRHIVSMKIVQNSSRRGILSFIQVSAVENHCKRPMRQYWSLSQVTRVPKNK